MITNKESDSIIRALNAFHIELPSWGFANTGTRFGKFLQPAAATTTAEKFADAGQVHRWTGVCPTVALHVLWDLPNGVADCGDVQKMAAEHGLRAGSINPNVFQDQIYKYGSLGNPDAAIRKEALDHILDCVEIAEAPGQPRSFPVVRRRLELSRHAEYPPPPQVVRGRPEGHPRRARRRAAHAGGVQAFRARLLPHRYRRLGHGACCSRRPPGRKAKVLVDTGHHYQAQNIEQIVAWLLDHGHARRLPLQRPPLCRRRSDHGLDRSLPGLPHLPRDRAFRVGDRASAPTSRT